MADTTAKLSLAQQYSLLKDFSTSDETEKLLMNILRESPDFDSKENQIEEAVGTWSSIQKKKIYFGIKGINDSIGMFNMLLAYSLKQIDNTRINIGIRNISNNTLEYWVICNEIDNGILDKVYDIYECYITKLAHPVEFVFAGKDQFLGREHIKFLEEI